MDTGGRLVAGSHNRNEFVLINADEIGRVILCFSFIFSLVDSRFSILSFIKLYFGSIFSSADTL